MPAILAWQASQRHIDCQKRNGVSGLRRFCPGRSRLVRERLARERLVSTIADRHRAQLSRMRSLLRKCSGAAAPLPQTPRGQHFQGSQAPKSAQAAQECQLLLNMRVRRGSGHATRTPRNAFGYRPLSDRSTNRAVAPDAHELGTPRRASRPSSSAEGACRARRDPSAPLSEWPCIPRSTGLGR
jgi:hypothetical protein